jgi:hypothetical protein
MVSVTSAFAYLLVGVFAHRAVLGADPLTLPLPPPTAWRIRFGALLSGGPGKFPLKNRLFLLVRAVIYLVGSLFWLALWAVDDVLFFPYKAVAIVRPIFLVGGFRTGSTSLHRAISLDDEKYVSPRFVELALPFLSVQFLLDFLEMLDGRLGTSFIKGIEARFHKLLGPETMARHPMFYYEAEEDDILHAAWHLSGWYIGTMFPDAAAWLSSGQMGAFPASEREKHFKFYERSLQKVLWRRGNGRALLSKSHLIEFMPELEQRIPDATFIGTVRNPKDTFVSWYGLAQAASRVMSAGWALETKDAVAVHMRFWDLFTAKEMEFFAETQEQGMKEKAKKSGGKTNKILIPFKDYIADQEATVRKIYKAMDVPISAAYEKALVADTERHKSYKEKREYKNDTLEELGTSGEEVEKRLAEYTNFFRL